jgi:FKBP-type peptidyl-prolyl cis-trans isomerase FkpA
MSRQTVLLLALVLMIASCSNQKTAGGLEFTIIKKGDGKIVQPGEYLELELVVRDEQDSVWLDTHTKNATTLVKVEKENEKFPSPGESGVYRMLSKGDSVSFDLDITTIYELTWMRPVPKKFRRDMKVNYTLKVLEIYSDSAYRAIQQQKNFRQEQERYQNQIRQFTLDTTQIEIYLRQKGKAVKRTTSGIRYLISKQGKGQPAATGDFAYVFYKGSLLDGSVFDSNQETKTPIPVEVGRQRVIAAWDEILKMMPAGTKLTIYLPSLLGYGDRGFDKIIPPNAILIFEMEISSIKRN